MRGDPNSEAERSIDDTEQMLRKLDGFEKAAVPWEARFSALEKVTAVSLIPDITVQAELSFLFL